MTPPEEKPAPKPPELLPKQVQWGPRKPATPLPADTAAATPAAPAISAKQVKWGAAKKPVEPPPAKSDPTVTHMPWAVPTGDTRPPTPPPKPKGMFAKLVPWSSGPAKKPTPPKPVPPTDTGGSWALPKNANASASAATPDQTEMEFARELQGQRDQSGEPTAEQLVAVLSRMAARTRDPVRETTPQLPYKARPISFEATRWDVVKIFVAKHRVRLSLGGAALIVALATAYLFKLIALNTEIDRQWLSVDQALRQRYATVPQYVECILAFSDNERFTLAFTERSLNAWRTAKTDQEVATAAARMERILVLLAKVMRRCEKETPAPEPSQVDSSAQFAELEAQRQQSRATAGELIVRYNAAVDDFNRRVVSAPGSWLAGVSGLRPRRTLFRNED